MKGIDNTFVKIDSCDLYVRISIEHKDTLH